MSFCCSCSCPQVWTSRTTLCPAKSLLVEAAWDVLVEANTTSHVESLIITKTLVPPFQKYHMPQIYVKLILVNIWAALIPCSRGRCKSAAGRVCAVGPPTVSKVLRRPTKSYITSAYTLGNILYELQKAAKAERSRERHVTYHNPPLSCFTRTLQTACPRPVSWVTHLPPSTLSPLRFPPNEPSSASI